MGSPCQGAPKEQDPAVPSLREERREDDLD